MEIGIILSTATEDPQPKLEAPIQSKPTTPSAPDKSSGDNNERGGGGGGGGGGIEKSIEPDEIPQFQFKPDKTFGFDSGDHLSEENTDSEATDEGESRFSEYRKTRKRKKEKEQRKKRDRISQFPRTCMKYS